MITNIAIEKLKPHPNNPRKDLGDLTELAESIKAQGVLQNLTVVPSNMEKWSQLVDDGARITAYNILSNCEYTVVIGHRRLAAAELAGLTEVPCSISEMDEKTQVATMLMENLQRSDLTVYEQAQGFQMMLDLGESVSSVSETTGFSETTIRRRINLLDLDAKKFKASCERGATLEDYAELEKVKDIKTKNKLLEKIGTSDFIWSLRKAVSDEESASRKEAMLEQVRSFATEIPDEETDKYNLVDQIYGTREVVEKPDDVDTVSYFFSIDRWGYITIYNDQEPETPAPTQEEIEEENLRKETELKKQQLTEAEKRAYELRSEFIKTVTASTIKKHTANIVLALIEAGMSDGWLEYGELSELLDSQNPSLIEDDDDDWKQPPADAVADAVLHEVSGAPEKILLRLVYMQFNDNENKRCRWSTWYTEYEKDDGLAAIYRMLESLGYEMSAEEKQLIDGTHELYKKDSDPS